MKGYTNSPATLYVNICWQWKKEKTLNSCYCSRLDVFWTLWIRSLCYINSLNVPVDNFTEMNWLAQIAIMMKYFMVLKTHHKIPVWRKMMPGWTELFLSSDYFHDKVALTVCLLVVFANKNRNLLEEIFGTGHLQCTLYHGKKKPKAHPNRRFLLWFIKYALTGLFRCFYQETNWLILSLHIFFFWTYYR